MNHLADAQSAATETPVVVALLGDVATRRADGALTPLPGARARTLLAALAMHVGRARSAQALIDDVWGDEPPRAPMNALHTQMSRLRAALPDAAVEVSPAGYRLALTKHQVDLTLARLLEQQAQQSHAEGAHEDAIAAVARARALWRGEPGADLPETELGRELAATAADRLAALDAVEIGARTALGDYDSALAPARAAVARDPLDEGAHAALMRVLAAVGRGNDALAVFAGIRTRLVERLGVDPGPELAELHTAILRGEGLVAPAPAARPAAPLAIGLRAAPTLLLGREADLNALDMLLDTARVVTVLGPGGTGKTRVANEIGLRRGSALPVVLVELAAVRSGEDVVAAISSVLGLGEVERAKPTSLAPTRIHTPMQRLRDALSERPSLLILDNCEHLIEAAAEVVADLVTSCEGLRVLTTSRSPLMIAAESVYPLAPLQIDEHGSPATELFMSRARAVRPSVRLEPGHVARLCRTLDGLPLAIELAAARVRTMSVEEINAGLSQRFSLLRSGDRTSPWRHRTLHAVIDWSWNLLDESQQAALRRLCRFPAGFTMAAARAAAGWGEAEDIEFAVEGLVNQSLLTVIEDQGGQGIRYRMLETVREYGEEQLAAAVEADDVMRRMAVWAQDFTSEQLVVFRAGRQADAVRAMLAEQENLLAVLRHQILEGRANRPVYQVFAALGGLWLLRGHHSELVSWSPRIIELGPLEADVPFDVATSALTLIAGHLMLVGSVRDAVRARIWLRRLLADPGEHTEVALFQARMLCWPVRDHRGLARMLARSARSADRATRLAALIVRANAHENNGSIAASLRDALVALPIAEAVGDVHSATMACQHIAGVYGQTARYREAAEYYRRGVAGFRQLHAHDEADQYAIFMAGALIGSGSIAEARQVLDSISPEMEREADGPGRADAFSSRRREILWSARGELLLAEGDVERGLADHRRALAASQWPAQGGLVGPFGLLLAAGMAGAHILHGRLAEVSTTIAEMADYMDRQFAQPFSDVPQLGAAVVAVGSYRIAAGVADDTGVELLALAPRLQPRQDLPSMLLERHHRAARAVVGDAAFDAALRRAARLPRAAAIPRALELLRKRP